MEARYHHQMLVHRMYRMIEDADPQGSGASSAPQGANGGGAAVPRRTYVETAAAEALGDVMEEFFQTLGKDARNIAWRRGAASVDASDLMEAAKKLESTDTKTKWNKSTTEQQKLIQMLKADRETRQESSDRGFQSNTDAAGRYENTTYGNEVSSRRAEHASPHMPPLPLEHTYYQTPVGFSRLAQPEKSNSSNPQRWYATFSHFLDARRSCEEAESSRKRQRGENGDSRQTERPSFDPFSAPSIPVASSSLRSSQEPISSSIPDGLAPGSDELRLPPDRFRMANAPSSSERAEGRTNDAQVQWEYHRQEMILRGNDPDSHEEEAEDQDAGAQQKTKES
eukprot:gb/GECG01005760.1/.p1 GENE.gb/GECG01005760.1/~~gb/GECG01005760.1/.p1  ORF type:complete len:339 (+),score=64.78 gb/GECG01005760.1/:1-1017(+)